MASRTEVTLGRDGPVVTPGGYNSAPGTQAGGFRCQRP